MLIEDPTAREFWLWFADLGDAAVILPAFLAVAGALVLCRRAKEAALWGAGLLLCIAATLTLKLAIGSFRLTVFGHGVRAASLPSGHAGLSMVFYGGLAMLIWYGTRSLAGRLAAAALILLEALIVTGVFLLGWHPILDLYSGLGLGVLCLLALWALRDPRPRGGAQIAAMLVSGAILVAAMHGVRTDDHRITLYLTRAVAAQRG
ncbi:MAG TPA: hypothetical protein VFA50_13185 [Stellaceae bacterium]|nr:hypothetical protein [Stellaceae bacterium]